MDAAFKNRLNSGDVVTGPWIGIPSITNIEVLARCGADYLLLDGEHGTLPPDSLAGLLPAVGSLPVVYRVRHGDSAHVKAALDCGIAALMVPMISTMAEAEAILRAAKYPPQGTRGIGPWRASNFYDDFAGYCARANAETTTILQIETRAGLDNAAAIAALDGVDMLYVGPADLSAALGLKVGVLGPDLLAACRKVAQSARAAGKVAGIDLATLDYLPALRDCGFTFFSHGSDIGFLQTGARDTFAAFRKAL